MKAKQSVEIKNGGQPLVPSKFVDVGEVWRELALIGDDRPSNFVSALNTVQRAMVRGGGTVEHVGNVREKQRAELFGGFHRQLGPF
jgi:hypothetical protein